MGRPLTVQHFPPRSPLPDSLKLVVCIAVGVWLGHVAALATWWFLILGQMP